VSFLAQGVTFILVTLHVDYGDRSADRVPELKGIARWMGDWAKRSNAWSHNLIALGDFNIDRQGDALWQAFTSTGLTVPADLTTVPRTVFADPSHPQTDKFYDQVAWFASASGVPELSIPFRKGGFVDFLPFVYTDQGLSKLAISYRVSDHFPLWCEFQLPH
jgi:endonuclease/exonuclease/phosphatase family metal-dependent hydrolase